MTSTYPFPVGIPSSWANPDHYSIADPCLKNWLLNAGSLTERLQSQCSNFHLTLIGQRQAKLTLEEFQQVCAPGQHFQIDEWQIREVLLWGDDQPWVFARSIIPQRLCETDFVNLNTMPLGHLIFKDKRFKRLPIEVTKMADTNTFLNALDLPHQPILWGRRSVFCFQELKMMVSEIFLPNSPAYIGIK